MENPAARRLRRKPFHGQGEFINSHWPSGFYGNIGSPNNHAKMTSSQYCGGRDIYYPSTRADAYDGTMLQIPTCPRDPAVGAVA